MKNQRVVLVGATGLCGKLVMELLLQHPACATLTILVRKPIPIQHPQLQQVICDYSSFNPDMIPPCDLVFCCLGTTINVAGSQEAFEAVDRHYPVAVAKAAFQKGATAFSIITAIGSNATSRVFYSRVKGLCEQDIQQIGFNSITILRPSMILGKRTERRLFEHIGQVLMKQLSWLIPARYRAVSAECIAETMVREAIQGKPGLAIIESEHIHCNR